MALGGGSRGKEVSVNLIAHDNVSGPVRKITTSAAEAGSALESAGDRGAAGMKQVSSAASNAAQSLEASAMQATLFGSAIMSALVVPMGLGTKAAWDQVGAVEQATLALRAYESDASKVNTVLSELLAYARSDAGRLFNRQELFAAAQGLKVMGAETENLSRYVQIMSRSVAVGAGTWDELGQVIGRVGSTGKLTGVEFDNLTKMGFQLDSSLRNTTVTWDELFNALDQGIGKVEGMTDTIRGQTIMTMSSLRSLGLAFLQVDADTSQFIEGGVGDKLVNGLGTARQLFAAMEPVARAAGSAIAFFADGAMLAVDAFLSLPSWLQSGTIALVGMTGAAIAGAGMLTMAITRLIAAGAALRLMFTTLAAHPIGVALAAVGVVIAAGLSLWARHRAEVEKAKQAYEALQNELQTTDQLIANMRLGGDGPMAMRMESMHRMWTSTLETMQAQAQAFDGDAFMDTLFGDLGTGHTRAEAGAKVQDFLNSAVGQSAIEWAEANEKEYAEIITRVLAGGDPDQIAQLTPVVKQMMTDYYSAFIIDDGQRAQIEDEINDLFELLSNPNVDSGAIFEGFVEAINAYRVHGDIGILIDDLNRLESEAIESAGAMNQLRADTEWLIELANMRLAGKGSLADDLERLNTALGDTSKSSEQTGMWIDFLIDGVKAGHLDVDDFAASINQLNFLLDQGLITQEQYDMYLESFIRNTANATAETNAFVAAMQGVGSAVRDVASEGIEQYNEALETMLDLYASLFNVAGFGDPLAQWNLSGNASDWSLLAMNIDMASTALDTVFRAVVTNTDALAKQTDSIKSWADALIGDPGTVAELDAAYARWIENGMSAAEAQERWNAAQAAQISITESNVRVQNAVTDIQLQQSPLIAEHTALLADQLETLSQLPAQQQLIALGWMDTTTAARAMEFQTLAVAAATGQMGAGGEEAFAQMIASAARLDPVLAAVLEDMGLISVGADGTITVHLSGVTESMSEIDKLTVAIVTLADLLDDNELNGSVSFEVLGLDDPRKELEDIDDLVVGLDGKVATVGVQLDDGSGGGSEGGGSFADRLGSLFENMPPLLVDVQPDRDSYYANLNDLVSQPVEPVEIPVAFIEAARGLGAAANEAASGVASSITVDVAVDYSQAQADIEAFAADGNYESTVTITADDSSASGMIANYQAMDQQAIATMYVWAIGRPESAQGMIDQYSAQDGGTLAQMYVWAIGNDSSVRGMMDYYSGLNGATLATMYIDLITRTSKISSNALGGVVQRYADGGVVVRAGENGPERAFLPNGTMAMLPSDGLYSLPHGTYISPNHATGNTYGGDTVFNITVNGGDEASIRRVMIDEVLPEFRRATAALNTGMGVM